MFPKARRAETQRFPSPRIKRKFPAHAKHKGYAFISFWSAEEASDAQSLLQGRQWDQHSVDTCKLNARTSPPGKLPAHWPRELALTQAQISEAALRAEAQGEQREHNRRQRQRRRVRDVEGLRAVIEQLSSPGGLDAESAYEDILRCSERAVATAAAHEKEEPSPSPVDWDGMPGPCRPDFTAIARHQTRRKAWGAELSERTRLQQTQLPKQVLRMQRKRAQVDSFALVLDTMLSSWPAQRRLRVVDFGSGSGALTLPLAYMLRERADVTAVDFKARSVEILNERAADAGLTNVVGMEGCIEAYTGECDVVLALHACGAATDYALLQAQRCRAAYIVSPCCVGKIKFRVDGMKHADSHYYKGDANEMQARIEDSLNHPRSEWMSVLSKNDFSKLAASADYSHQDSDKHDHLDLAHLAKTNIELDRNLAAEDDGYITAIVKLLQADLTTKNDMLIGVPRERLHEFNWVWDS